jgi:hypothetical protein
MILKNRKLQFIVFLAISLALVVLAAMQYPQLMVVIGTVSWNR